MGRKKSHYKYFCVLYTKYGKVFYEKSFLQKGGYFCMIRQILTRKRAKSLILHIMKSILHIMKLHEISYNFYFTHNEIVWNHNEIIYCMQYYAYCIQNRRFWLLCIYTNGGNLCKYAYHLLYINATFIRFIQSIATHIHKYSKNIPFFVQFLYVFVPKLAKNCTKLDIFVPKLYKK